jgi:hypothetical protein
MSVRSSPFPLPAPISATGIVAPMSLFDYYDEPQLSNDLMSIINILDGNVKSIVLTSHLNPKVIPKATSKQKYTEVLSSFSSFLEFYENMPEEGEHSEILAYYKLRHSRLSLVALHSHYLRLKKMEEIDKEDSGYYNEDLCKALIECNEYVANRGTSDIFLAPFHLAQFFRRSGEPGKYKALRKEARNIAKTYNKLNVIRMLEDVDEEE